MSKKHKNNNDPYNNEMYEECKGCVIVTNCNLEPRFESNGIIEECPCSTCLVKGICLPMCKRLERYDDLYNLYNDENHE